MDERTERSHPLGTFTVERVIREDGRYLLYYSWPEPPAADATDHPAAGEGGAAEAQRPWTPEAGPVERGDDDV